MAELGVDIAKTLVANIYSAAVSTFGPKFLDEAVVKQFVDGVESIKRGVEALRHVDYKRAVDLIDEASNLIQVRTRLETKIFASLFSLFGQQSL